MRNIILADNQDISRVGIQFILQSHYENTEIQIVDHKKDLLNCLSNNLESFVILDYTLFDFESVNELVFLQSRFPHVDWLLFSNELSDDFIRTLLFNTDSYSILLKDCSLDEISRGIRESIKGNRFICNLVSNILLDNSKSISQHSAKQILTPTEQAILKEMALGKTTKEIATMRHVSAHTIMTHRKNIFRKIEVNNVHEATKYAMRAGIVDMAEYYI